MKPSNQKNARCEMKLEFIRNLAFCVCSFDALAEAYSSTQMVALVIPCISLEMVGRGPSLLNTPWK